MTILAVPYSFASGFYADYSRALSKSLGGQPVSGQIKLVQEHYDLIANNVLVDRSLKQSDVRITIMKG